MPVAEVGPWYLEHKYTSAQGEHKQVLNVSAPFFAISPAEYTWDIGASNIALSTLIDEFVIALAPFHLPTTTIGEVTLWYKATPSSIPEAKQFYDNPTVGTSVSTAWARAVQKTLTFRCSDSSIFKFVILNSPASSFLKVTNPSDPSVAGLIGFLQTFAPGVFVSRRGGTVGPFLQYSVTLNETLRKQYNLT